MIYKETQIILATSFFKDRKIEGAIALVKQNQQALRIIRLNGGRDAEDTAEIRKMGERIQQITMKSALKGGRSEFIMNTKKMG